MLLLTTIDSMVYNDLGIIDKAIYDITRAIELEEVSDYYVHRALIYKSQNKSEASLSDFNKAIDLDPEKWISIY